jgi:hypothetical protein
MKMNINNPKKLWRTIKGLYKNDQNVIKFVQFGEITVNDESVIANSLNNAFVESIESIVSEIPAPLLNDYNDKILQVNAVFEIKQVELEELKIIVSSLKSKSFDDNISGRVLNDIIENDVIANKLRRIVNKSITESTMPDIFKESAVTPIPKVASPITPNDYRPINNLPVIEKIIESVIHSQLSEYIEDNKILSSNQSGFRKNHSTETSIQSVLFDWYNATEKGECIVGVFLDLRRAFETVNRKCLIDKLNKYGMCDKSLKWFQSYLSNRRQYVKVNGRRSESKLVSYGLPQGSKLSNLLFIIFMNDLTNVTGDVGLNLFADDALLYVKDKSIRNAESRIMAALEKVSDWLRFNTMSLNAKKCNFIVINDKTRSTVDISIEGVVIERKNCVKYLGIWIDDKLRFQCHFEKLKSKIMKKVGLLRRLNRTMTREARITFLKAIILPNYDYCSSILMIFDSSWINTIQKCINKAMRAALLLPFDSSATLMRDELDILSVRQRINFNAIKIINKTISRGLPLNMAEISLTRSELRTRTLRNDSNISLPFWKNMRNRRSLFYEGVKMFNSFRSQFKDPNQFYSNCIKFVKQE